METSCAIQVNLTPAEADIERLRKKLRAFNVARAGEGGRQAFLINLVSEQHEWIGGLFASASRGWLFIDTLWISEEHRGAGNGQRLLKAAEQQARLLGCRNTWVDTFSFQARGFYEKNGYSVFGELADYPSGHSRYFLRKAL